MREDLNVRVTQTHALSQQALLLIRLLQMNATALAEYAQEQLIENPALEQIPPARETPERVQTGYRSRGRGRAVGRADDLAWIEQPVVFSEYLAGQLDVHALCEDVLGVAKLLCENIDEDGYLREDLDGIAARAGVCRAHAQEALRAVQALDPPGVGARSLAECLSIQLARLHEPDALAFTIVDKHLEALASRKYAQIAKECGATVERVKACARRIAQLDPKPGSPFGKTAYIAPDLSILPDDAGELEIVYFDDYYPRLAVDPSFAAMTEAARDADRKYMRTKLHTANQLIRAMETRRNTLERVIRIVVDAQRAYFLHGGALRPLRYREVADQIGVHESTVYRVAQEKYAICLAGVRPVADFFQRDVAGYGSVDEARRMIREICADEPGLSDERIRARLEARGVRLARRTIAKYRAAMGIDASFDRSRKQKNLE